MVPLPLAGPAACRHLGRRRPFPDRLRQPDEAVNRCSPSTPAYDRRKWEPGCRAATALASLNVLAKLTASLIAARVCRETQVSPAGGGGMRPDVEIRYNLDED